MNNYIKREVERLKNKYKTQDPYEIARCENIIIIKEPLGSIHGYYNKYARQKFIHINSDLDEVSQYITCSHELGHARLHPNANTPFFRSNTFLSINKLERQANKFAAELLIDENIIKNHSLENYNLEQFSAFFGVPIDLMKIKFNLV